MALARGICPDADGAGDVVPVEREFAGSSPVVSGRTGISVAVVFRFGNAFDDCEKTVAVFLTLPVGSRKIYWNYYSGSLLLCLTFASTLFLTQEFILRNLILGISLLLLAHAVMFWGGLLRRDGGGSVVGLLILFPLYLACYPLIQFLTALFAVLLFHSVEISLILQLLTGEDAPLPTLEYYITIPLIALAFALAFALAGASLWNKEIIRGRKGMKRTVWFTVLLLATPFLAAVLGYAAVSCADCLLHDYWSRQPGFLEQ